MSQAIEVHAEAYTDFNHFFTRELKSGLRQIIREEDDVACPVDGFVSQIGKIDATNFIQAKGRYYDLKQLLAADEELSKLFKDGLFATLYLSPRDYHRIHMPRDGVLNKMIYVPGKLFAVNTHSTRIVDQLFARNERIISLFETDIGPMAIIMVGAIFVGSMETVWAGQITPAKKREIIKWSYNDQNNKIKLQRGDELGRFNMGSTVILLFPAETIQWSPAINAKSFITMGSRLGKIKCWTSQ